MKTGFSSSDYTKRNHTVSYKLEIGSTDVTQYVVKYQPNFREKLTDDIFGVADNQQFNFYIIDNATTQAALAVGAQELVTLTITLDGTDIVLAGQTTTYYSTEYVTDGDRIREVVCQVLFPYALENTFASLFMHSITVGTNQVELHRDGYDLDLDITANTIVSTGVHVFNRKYNSGEYYQLNDGDWVEWESGGINLTDSAGNDIDLNDNTGFTRTDELNTVSVYINTSGSVYPPATYEKVIDIESNAEGLSKNKTDSSDLGTVATDIFSTSPLGLGVETADIIDVQSIANASAYKSFLVLTDEGEVKFVSYREDLSDDYIVDIDSSREWHRIYFHRKDTSNYIITMVRVDSASDIYVKRYNLPSTALETGSVTLLEETNITPSTGFSFWNDSKNIYFNDAPFAVFLEWKRITTGGNQAQWEAAYHYEDLDDGSTATSGTQILQTTDTNPIIHEEGIYGFCYGTRHDDDSEDAGYILWTATYTDDSVTNNTITWLSLIDSKGSGVQQTVCSDDFTAKLVNDEAEQGWCQAKPNGTGTTANSIDEIYFENFYYRDLTGTPSLQEFSIKAGSSFVRCRRPIYHPQRDYWAILLCTNDSTEEQRAMVWIDNDDLESYTSNDIGNTYYQDVNWYNVPTFISIKTPGIVWGSGSTALEGLDAGNTDIMVFGEDTQFSPSAIQFVLISKNFKYVYPYFKVENDSKTEMDKFCNSMMLFCFVDYDNSEYTYKELEDLYNSTGITTDLSEIGSEIFIKNLPITVTGIKIFNEDTGQSYLKGESPYEEIEVNIWHKGQMKRIAEVLYAYYTADSIIECKGFNFIILDLFDTITFDSTLYFITESNFVDENCKIKLLEKVTL